MSRKILLYQTFSDIIKTQMKGEYLMTLSEKIKKERTKRKITLEGLAKAVGSSKGYIWQIENDPNIKPSAQLIAKIAKSLNVTIDYLVDSEKEKMGTPDNSLVFFRNFEELNKESQETLLRQMEALMGVLKEQDEAKS
ncbi:MAG: helix-turn-helix transcriptional regulator [Syntrophales bacterium]|nr:helix-turn-helix transcriptional regulator [Syntrophales bacterium]